jgi:subtilisin family serine protease
MSGRAGMLTRSRRRIAGVLAVLAGFQAAALLLASPASADSVRNTERWVLDALNVQSAWATTQGQGVIVAVIDSGVNPEVSDLAGSVRTGPNLTGVRTLSSNPFWGVHGTWMASLIAGHGHGGGGGSGIIGVAPRSTILSIRVITDQDDPNNAAYEHEPVSLGQDELARAIRYAVAHGASVISMSLGYSLQSRTVRLALQDAFNNNVVVVASAGNSGDTAGRTAASGSGQAPQTSQAPYSFPANYPGVLAVAAVDRSGQPAIFSSDNWSVQVAAPGDEVPAQGRDGQYWLVSGTSPACALVAGVAALIKAKYRQLTDPEVISAITSSTTRSSRPAHGYNDEVGSGEANAGAALAAAARLAAAPAPKPPLPPGEHFGGGIAAIPAPPVQPRGKSDLVLYCLLGLCSLAAVALAVSRLLTFSEPLAGGAAAGGAAAGGPALRSSAGPGGRHAAPRGRGDDNAAGGAARG